MARVLGIGLLVFLLVVLGTAIRPVWTIDPDASLYVALARSLVVTGTYAIDAVPHTKYPPGFALALAPLVAAGGPEAYAAFHLLSVLCLVGAVAMTFFLLRRLGLAPGPCLAIAAATGLSQTLFELAVVYLRSEPLFLLLSLGALLAACGALWPRSRPGLGRVVLAALLIAAAIATRLAGIALLALPAVALLERQRRATATVLLLVGLLTLGAWQLRAARIAATVPGATDYGAELTVAEPRDLTKVQRADNPPLDGPALLRRVAGNLDVLARATATLLTNWDRAAHRLPVGATLLLVVLVGLVRLARSPGPRRAAAAYVAASFALYLVWPFNQQERFYVPLLPLLLVAAGFGVIDLWARARSWVALPSGRTAIKLVMLGLLLVLGAQHSDRPVVLGRWSPAYAGLLVVAAIGATLVVRQLHRGTLPELSPRLLLLYVGLVALPFVALRWREWPQRVQAFDQRRAEHPRTGPLARIDVHPALEEVALWMSREMGPEAVLMTDVPGMLRILGERRCVPFVYRVDPPEVLVGDAGFVFYTREIPEAAAVVDACSGPWQAALTLPPLAEDGLAVSPTVWRLPR